VDKVDELHLSIDSHVVVQLGAELISDSEQALLELVKNAYDGDATRCTIQIEPDWVPNSSHPWFEHFKSHLESKGRIGRIVVEDDGVGLTEDVVSRGWLQISASLKRPTDGQKRKTAKNRTPVGDKGLGRLATMRLGDVLFLCTRAKGEDALRTVSFAWSDFKSGTSLEKVPVRRGHGTSLRGRDHGTNVEILGLNEPQFWESSKNITGVVAKLSTLISPFKRFQDFHVRLRLNEETYDLQTLSAEALGFASARFMFDYKNKTLSFTADFAKPLFRGATGEEKQKIYEELLSPENLPHALSYFQNHKRLSKLNFQSKVGLPGSWLFSLNESMLWSDIASDPKFMGGTDPGDFHAEIHYVLFNEPTKQAMQAAGLSVDILQDMTAVGMFRDGFRVRMSDDWLELSKGVTSGGFFQLRPKNVVGYFAISNDSNGRLIEKSDREGFVDNEAWRGFMALAMRARKLANDSLEDVRKTYLDYKKDRLGPDGADGGKPLTVQDAAQELRERQRQAFESLRIARKRGSEMTATLQRMKETHGADGQLSAELEQVTGALMTLDQLLSTAEANANAGSSAANQLAESNEQLVEHNLRLIDAAAVGLSARALTHEISAHVSMIDRGLNNVRKANKSRGDKKLGEAVDKITGAVRELRKSVASINPLLSGSRSLKDNFYVGDAVREFVHLRSVRAAEAKVIVEVTGARGAEIRFAKARFNQILENLFQNSLYWIDEHSRSDAAVRKQIAIEIGEHGFVWWDGGRGVRQTFEDRLFEPYVTDKPSSKGQGLGLFLVTAFLEAEKSHIKLLQDRNQWGRRFKFAVDLSGAETK
jgi:signal transduction histidine kinase